MTTTSNLRLFALGPTQPFGARVAGALGLELDPHEFRRFEDGEHKTRPLVSVRGADVFVIDSLHSDASESVNDKLCRLLFFLGALRDASAARITAVLPYLCYARKDQRTKSGDPVITRYLAALFEAVGVDRIVTLDVHNLAAYDNAFRCIAEHLEARPLLIEHLLQTPPDGDLVVLSPDVGGMKRAEAFRQTLEKALDRTVDIGSMEKQRSGGVVSGTRLFAEVRERTVILVDDLIATGTTLVRAARAAHDNGARQVIAVASHGLFVPSAAQVLSDPALDRIVVTDTLPPARLLGTPVAAKLELVDSSGLFAEAIGRIHAGQALSEPYDS